jgi:alanine dehydrogenase
MAAMTDHDRTLPGADHDVNLMIDGRRCETRLDGREVLDSPTWGDDRRRRGGNDATRRRCSQEEVSAVKVGIPREIKNHEYRVAITPAGVNEFSRQGHEVYVESGAGMGSSISDDEFKNAGAMIVPTADDVWAEGDLILKVKEPIEEEYGRMRDGQVLFTYLHLAASRACTDALLEQGVTAIAYETVELPDRSLPLLAPMSEVAGRLAPMVGSYHLMRSGGGRGVLMGGVPGVYAAKVVVIGAGVSGMNAAAIALGMQAEVLLLDKNIARLRAADADYRGHAQTVASNAYEIERAVLDADLVVGAVLVPGAKAPKLVTNELVSRMKPGSVLVDISIDQGGCFEDSRPTTHADPVYTVHNSIFYCVANMPGAVPHTSTYALTNVTLPYALEIANHGWREALRRDRALALGLNTHAGQVTNAPVAEAHALEPVKLEEVLT